MSCAACRVGSAAGHQQAERRPAVSDDRVPHVRRRPLLLGLGGTTRNGDRRSDIGGPPGRPGSGAASVRADGRAAAFGEGAPGVRGGVAAGAPSAGSIRAAMPGSAVTLLVRPALEQLGRPGQVPWRAGSARRSRAGRRPPRHAVDELLVVGRGGAAQGQRHRAEAQLEQAVAARGLGVVVALGRGVREDLDLARVEAEALVDALRLRLERAVVGQEDARRAALDQRRRDGRALDVGQRLGGEHHRDVLLAQRLEPLADAGGEQRRRRGRSRPRRGSSSVGRPSKRASRRWNR